MAKIGKSCKVATSIFSYRKLDPVRIASGAHQGPDFPPPLQRGQVFSGYSEFVAFLARRVLAKRGEIPGRIMVNITGGTNAGKSTLARELERDLNVQGMKDTIHFSEDFALGGWQTMNQWRASGDPRFEDCWGAWFRWTVVRDFFDKFRNPTVSAIHYNDLFNKSDQGRLTLVRDFRLTGKTLLLYDGVFTFDTKHYPTGFEFSVFLSVTFAEAMRMSIAKGRPEKTVRENYRRCFVPSQLSYRESIHPEQRADLVVDLNNFNRPQILIYRR